MEQRQNNPNRPLKIHITPTASHDLTEISNYIAQDSMSAAHRMRERIVARIGQLAEYPGKGRPAQIPGLEQRGIRVAGEGRYHIYYQADEQALRIFHVFHSARRITALHFNSKEKAE
jgi:plasmid stabilization system protein ParE